MPTSTDIDFRTENCETSCQIPVHIPCTHGCGYTVVYCGACGEGRDEAHVAIEAHEDLKCTRKPR